MPLIFAVVPDFQRANKSKKKWFGKARKSVSDSSNPEPFEVSNPHPLPQLESSKLTELENEQTEHAEVSSEAVRLTTLTQFAGGPHEVAAAIKIQTAFRGYLVCHNTNFTISYVIARLDEIVIDLSFKFEERTLARRCSYLCS